MRRGEYHRVNTFVHALLYTLIFLTLAHCAKQGGLHTSFSATPTGGPAPLTVTSTDTPIRYVKPGGTGDGMSWATAFGSIQDGAYAVSAAGGGQVWVAAGTYSLTFSTKIKLPDGVQLFGHFAGTESYLSDRNLADNNNTTIVDGNNATPCFIRAGSGNALISDFTIRNGKGELDGGGGIWSIRGTLTIKDCVFSGNVAGGDGGAILVEEGSLIITNCVFRENKAGNGGAICNKWSGPSVITNCTFTGNTASGMGGAINNCWAYNTITNCILWGDTAASGNEVYDDNLSRSTITYSCVNLPGTGNINKDPLFVNAAGGDLRLQSASPCIDTGTAAGAPDTDILGVKRPQGNGYDMGAYEYVP